MKNSVNRLKLVSKSDNIHNKLILFLRNQDYYLNRLLNKNGMKSSSNNILIKNENNKAFPFIKIKKIVRVGRNGFYSFKKIDYNYSYKNKKSHRDFEKINNNQHNNKKTLIRYNSCHLFNKNKTLYKNLENKKTINNPLIITHINNVKINSKSTNNFHKYKRNFSSKSVQKEEIKSSINNIKLRNFILLQKSKCMIICKKNEGNQMNFNDKESNIFFSENKIKKIKIDYCSPKSIIFQRNLMNN